MRAFIFGLGSNDKNIRKKNEALLKAFNRPVNHGSEVSVYSIDPTWLLIGGLAATSFHSADTTTGVDESSSSSSSFGGSGPSGSGGGSGAF